MSQAPRSMTETEATIVYQAATMAGLNKQLMDATNAINQIQSQNAQLRVLVPDKALSSDAELKVWQGTVAEMNKEYANAGGKPPDGPVAANDPPAATPAPPPQSTVTPINGKRK